MNLLAYIASFIFVIALIGGSAWLLRGVLFGDGLPGSRVFFTPREKRTGVVETSSVDGRRRLVLIRRDGVEHLIMTGGPVDVVIETGIEPGDQELTTLSTNTFAERAAGVVRQTRQVQEAQLAGEEDEEDGEPVFVARGHERPVNLHEEKP